MPALSRRLALTLTALNLAAVGAVAIGAATAATTPTAVKACTTSNGALKLLRSDGSCPSGSTHVSINKRGPAGPKGDTGPKGEPGDASSGRAVSLDGFTTTSGDTVASKTIGGLTFKLHCSPLQGTDQASLKVSSSPSSHTEGYDVFLFTRISSNVGATSLLTQVKSSGLAPGDDGTLATANLSGTTDTSHAITVTGVVRQQLSSTSGDVSITATLTFTRDPSNTCILAGTASQGIKV